MICAVMQPTYLPWSGYFNLAARSDIFVLLDDVQFEKQSWQSRNRILLNGQSQMLSVPVRRTGLQTQIREVEINYASDWVSAHLRSLEHAYGRAAHGPEMIAVIRPLLEARLLLLADLTISIIRAAAAQLGLATRMVRASELEGISGGRSDHVIAICAAVGATHYLSPAGSREYMESDDFEARAGIPVSYQHYEPAPYRQRRTDTFISHLSIVDVAAHLGWAAAGRYVAGSAE